MLGCRPAALAVTVSAVRTERFVADIEEDGAVRSDGTVDTPLIHRLLCLLSTSRRLGDFVQPVGASRITLMRVTRGTQTRQTSYGPNKTPSPHIIRFLLKALLKSSENDISELGSVRTEDPPTDVYHRSTHIPSETTCEIQSVSSAEHSC